jgi:glycosyltransferase involved in cell wall biosynthesis
MRIVYYNRLLNEPWGCGVHGRALVRAWRRAGHDVLCLPNALAEGSDAPTSSGMARFWWVPPLARIPAMDVRGRLRSSSSTKRLVAEVGEFAPDIFVARRAAYDYVLDSLRARITVPVVAEVNALLHWELPSVVHEYVLPWEGRREVSFLRDATCTVAVSDAVAAQLRACGVDPKRIHVVPNGVDVTAFSPESPLDEEVLSWATRMNRVVAYCGTLAAHHDMRTLARAVDYLWDRSSIGFLFVGPSRAELASSVGDEVAASGRVKCTGRVAHERVAGLLGCADVGWAAMSNDRVSSLKLLEYMAMGLPVVIADERQGSELVASVGCGYSVRRGDSDGLARAVLELVLDKNKAAEMGNRGREWVAMSSSWDDVASQMVGCVTELPRM